MTAPTRAEMVALLADVEAYLSPRSEASEADRPNEAANLSVGVSRAREALERAESATPPMVCTGSGRPPGWLTSASTMGGTCGICGREVGVGPLGQCTTHPWPVSPLVVQPEPLAAALIRWLDENVSKCGHGYVFVTCARCVIDQGGLR